jgi:hypothetical protein
MGVPRDESADPTLNSTEFVGELLELWLRLHYPYVRVVRVHSRLNVFK